MSPQQQNVAERYNQLYQEKYSQLIQGGLDETEAEREAQKHSIKAVALEQIRDANVSDKAKAWNMIYQAHVARRSGVDVAPETVKKVISADQSWKKSSGHAFEELVKELTNEALEGTGISVLLQRDLKKLLDEGSLRNEERDITWLSEQMSGDVFDLFALKDGTVFGCIQSKTSIRDRVTRDREPSLHAMDRYFWSIVFTLDGDFLRLPKFQSMVNGGTTEFPNNGWHAMYVFSLPATAPHGDRIFVVDASLAAFREHAVRAAADWFGRGRQWMKHDWRA